MAESNDRSSAKRNEDSGLIDLDALMRQADPSPPAESATPAASAAPAARTTSSLTETPAPVSSKAVPAAAVSAPASSKKASEEKAKTPEPVPSSKAVAAAAASSKSVAEAAAASAPRSSSRRADDSLDGVASPSVPPSSQLSAPASAKGAEPVAAKAEAVAASSSNTQERKRSKVVPLLVAAALLGLVGFTASRFLNSKAPDTTAAPLPTAVRTNEVAHAAPTPSEQPAETAAVDTKEPAPAESASAAPAERPRTASAGKHAAGPAAPSASADPSLTLKEIQTAPTEQGDLAAAMRGAADGGYASGNGLANEPTKNANARQLRPSPGSVIGAINAVLPSARACLAPDDPIRKGSIVFSSDGSVQKVDMRGQKAEDECVRTALSKARVQPFVDDSFTTPVTVRP